MQIVKVLLRLSGGLDPMGKTVRFFESGDLSRFFMP
jgi:hypothetical protein